MNKLTYYLRPTGRVFEMKKHGTKPRKTNKNIKLHF